MISIVLLATVYFLYGIWSFYTDEYSFMIGLPFPLIVMMLMMGYLEIRKPPLFLIFGISACLLLLNVVLLMGDAIIKSLSYFPQGMCEHLYVITLMVIFLVLSGNLLGIFLYGLISVKFFIIIYALMGIVFGIMLRMIISEFSLIIISTSIGT